MVDRKLCIPGADEEQHQHRPTTPGKEVEAESPGAYSARQQQRSPMSSIPAFYGARAGTPPPPFRFSAQRTRIHWHTLHGVDIDKLVLSASSASNASPCPLHACTMPSLA